MKAILVIDEMPKSCDACPLTYIDYGDDAYYGTHIRRCIFDDAEADANERYYDCPLKPMPQKKETDSTGTIDEYMLKGYDRGWNDCLKEICDAD